MIILDTHVWLWLATDSARLRTAQLAAIANARERGTAVGVSIISCWEIAKAVELKRIDLPNGPPRQSLRQWFDQAITATGVVIFDITLSIVTESTSLPGNFHQDPFDQMIVATARIYNCPLATADRVIRAYPYVQTIY